MELNYPIIVLDVDHMIYAFRSAKEFLITTEEGLDRKAYDTGLIIDSSGRKFELIGAEKTGWGNFFFGYSLLVKGRLIRVKPKLKKLDRILFSDVRELIIKNLKLTKKDKWVDHGGLSGMIKLVESTNSLKDLVNIFR